VASFARRDRCLAPSFPRKRIYYASHWKCAADRDWIPTFAGMTGVSKRIPIPNDTSTSGMTGLEVLYEFG